MSEGRRGLFRLDISSGSTMVLPSVSGGSHRVGGHGASAGGRLWLVGLAPPVLDRRTAGSSRPVHPAHKMRETPTFEEIKSEEQIGDVPALGWSRITSGT